MSRLDQNTQFLYQLSESRTNISEEVLSQWFSEIYPNISEKEKTQKIEVINKEKTICREHTVIFQILEILQNTQRIKIDRKIKKYILDSQYFRKLLLQCLLQHLPDTAFAKNFDQLVRLYEATQPLILSGNAVVLQVGKEIFNMAYYKTEELLKIATQTIEILEKSASSLTFCEAATYRAKAYQTIVESIEMRELKKKATNSAIASTSFLTIAIGCGIMLGIVASHGILLPFLLLLIPSQIICIYSSIQFLAKYITFSKQYTNKNIAKNPLAFTMNAFLKAKTAGELESVKLTQVRPLETLAEPVRRTASSPVFFPLQAAANTSEEAHIINLQKP